MPVISLTSSGIRTHSVAMERSELPPGEYRDSHLKGFLLHVGKPSAKNPKGAHTWNFDYWNRENIHRRLALGRLPGLSPDGARKLALRVAAEVAGGVDVFAERKAARAEADRAKSATLSAFMQRHYTAWATSHLKSGEFAVARIKVDFKAWYPRPMTQITPFLAENWRKAQLQKGKKPRTVNRDLQRLQSVLAKAKEMGVIPANPLTGIKPLRFDKRGRVRYLTAVESAALRRALVTRESRLREARDRFNEWRTTRGMKPLPQRTEEFVDHLRPMTLLALNTGLRRGEIFSFVGRTSIRSRRF